MHKLVYNGGFSNFELPLLVQNSTYVTQILCRLSYKVWSTFITKFATIELFILILDIPPLYTSRLVAMLWQHQTLIYILNKHVLFEMHFIQIIVMQLGFWNS